jgi:DNA-binding response OmpR family regulator
MILVVDDDIDLVDIVRSALEREGFAVDDAGDGETALTKIAGDAPELVVLDLGLPKVRGLDVLRRVREDNPVPVIVLSGMSDEADRIVGLELGADDYLPKPFEPRELVARIQSVLRRPRAVEREVRRFGPLAIDLTRRQAALDGAPIELTTNEFEVLRLLTDHPGAVLDRDRILETLRGIEHEAFNRTVDVAVSRLRQKLGDDPKTPRFIRTVWGRGYVFIAPESQPEGGDDAAR